MASLVTTTVAGTLTVNPDADSALEIVNGGTNAIVLRAKTGDELYVGSNGANAVRFPSAGGIDVTGTGTSIGALTVFPTRQEWDGTSHHGELQIASTTSPLQLGCHGSCPTGTIFSNGMVLVQQLKAHAHPIPVMITCPMARQFRTAGTTS